MEVKQHSYAFGSDDSPPTGRTATHQWQARAKGTSPNTSRGTVEAASSDRGEFPLDRQERAMVEHFVTAVCGEERPAKVLNWRKYGF